MMEKLYNFIKTHIKDKKLKEFVIHVLKENEAKFSIIPASLSYHGKDSGVQGSNLKHIIRMFKFAIALQQLLAAEPYNINMDRLFAAIVLHDIGKLKCYSKASGKWEYFGVQSQLHPAIGSEMVSQYARSFKINVNDIVDAISTHYGYYGPDEPTSPLGWALFLLEMLETKCKS